MAKPSKAELAEAQELLGELDAIAEPKPARKHTAREERIISGFEDIQRFVEEHERSPAHGEDRDIFERLYAVRLDRIRALPEAPELLGVLDHQDLLDVAAAPSYKPDMDAAALLVELGVDPEAAVDITQLRHVKPHAEKRAAEEIANRSRCADFETFKPLFEQVQRELSEGQRQTRPFEIKAEIRPGSLFVLGGQKVYVAEMGDVFITPQRRTDARLRVIFDNGTESNLLLRSLQRALNKDEAGRRITDPVAGPLFADTADEDDLQSGTIYVVRSKADHPAIAANRDLIHKIGVTGGDVEKRLANAAKDATFLLADVELVATYDVYNVSRTKIENLLHKVLSPARIDLEIPDRFGQAVKPREWFRVPLPVIDDVVQKLIDGTISQYRYDPETASLRTD